MRSMVVVLAMLAAIPGGAMAQAAERLRDDVCYGFAFGVWTPRLDRAAAGHDPAAPGGVGAPRGRDWAVDDSTAGRASLMLFPGWWPAGVRVQLNSPPPAVGDTVRGTATALVADARVRSPSAPVRAWGIPCSGARVPVSPKEPDTGPPAPLVERLP